VGSLAAPGGSRLAGGGGGPRLSAMNNRGRQNGETFVAAIVKDRARLEHTPCVAGRGQNFSDGGAAIVIQLGTSRRERRLTF